MLFQSIHAPFTKMRDMWFPTEHTEAAVQELLACLRDCATHGVPVMVAHAFIGFHDHEPTAFGLENYARVAAEAERLQVKIAFENTEGEEYLLALMAHFAGNPWVGFCWDTGHQMCYNPTTDMMALFGQRLIATHINDNLGVKDAGHITWTDDLHLLPFDGVAPWEKNAEALCASGFSGPLTFELTRISKPNRHENDGYAAMPLADYLALAYGRTCRVAALVAQV